MSEGEGAWEDWLKAQGAPPAGDGPAALLRAIRGHPLLIGLVALAAVFAAGLWQATRPSTYEATAEILVTPAPDDGGPDRSLPLLRESGDRTRIVQTAATLVDSEGAARRTADELGAGWTPERVAGAVTVEPVGQTDVLAVTAQADDPELATSVANTFAESALDARADMLRPRLDAFLRQVQRELEAQDDPSSAVTLELTQRLSELRAVAAAGDPTLSLTRLAATGEGPVGTPSWIIVAAALIAGLAVGVGAALVIDLVAPGRIADPAQVSAMTEAPVLARVPVPRSAGGVPPAAVATAYRTVELQLPADAAGRRVVLVVSPSGEGAAACVADFGIALAQAGRDVLVVDLDGPGGSLAARFGDSTAPGGAQANGDAPPPLPRLRLLPVHAVRAGGGDPRELTDLLAAVSDRHDCVLVHAPALTESAEALRVAAVVQAVVLVVRLRRTSQTDLDLALRQLYSVDRVPAGVIVVSGWEHQRRSSLPAAPATIEPPSVAEPAPRQRRHAQPRPKRRL